MIMTMMTTTTKMMMMMICLHTHMYPFKIKIIFSAIRSELCFSGLPYIKADKVCSETRVLLTYMVFPLLSFHILHS
jgi:hypothetical protein